ncbi:sensor histidine kinase [Parafrankia sp. FMc2]|uniref:sensor histidine kinase n=1 Tax=Parafrankia sp. FMc2 TaxID=3233196 RepID=UPI0034D6147E
MRWPRATDAGLALTSFLMTVFVVDGPGDTMSVRPVDDVPVLTLLVCAVTSPAVYWRRRAPLAVLGLALTGWVVLLGSGLLGSGNTPPAWATIIGLYAAGRYATGDWKGAAGVAAAVVLVSADGLDDPGPWWQVLVFGGLVMSGAWYIGSRVQLRQDRAAQQRRERAAETRRIVAEERTRIARELHDVVAHRVSLMTVQASGARAVATEDPQAALQAMGAVEEAGRQALDELRHLLGVLRPEADPDELGPQPGLADLPRLAEQIRRAGVGVRLVTAALPAGLPARTDLFAYRIIQEALTNVLKHAGPGTPAEVRLCVGRKEIAIEIHDQGGGTSASGAGDTVRRSGGHGIIGMRERALLLGGSLDAEPCEGGGFRVIAHLPIGGKPA